MTYYQHLIWRWSIFLASLISFALVVWSLIWTVPSVDIVKITPQLTWQLPLSISYWWLIPIVAFLTASLVCYFFKYQPEYNYMLIVGFGIGVVLLLAGELFIELSKKILFIEFDFIFLIFVSLCLLTLIANLGAMVLSKLKINLSNYKLISGILFGLVGALFVIIIFNSLWTLAYEQGVLAEKIFPGKGAEGEKFTIDGLSLLALFSDGVIIWLGSVLIWIRLDDWGVINWLKAKDKQGS